MSILRMWFLQSYHFFSGHDFHSAILLQDGLPWQVGQTGHLPSSVRLAQGKDTLRSISSWLARANLVTLKVLFFQGQTGTSGVSS